MKMILTSFTLVVGLVVFCYGHTVLLSKVQATDHGVRGYILHRRQVAEKKSSPAQSHAVHRRSYGSELNFDFQKYDNPFISNDGGEDLVASASAHDGYGGYGHFGGIYSFLPYPPPHHGPYPGPYPPLFGQQHHEFLGRDYNNRWGDKFNLPCHGFGCGRGSNKGYGYNNQHGHGYEYEYEYGHGYGNGHGNGHAHGHGNEHGHAYGHEHGRGHGNGRDNGHGHGHGNHPNFGDDYCDYDSNKSIEPMQSTEPPHTHKPSPSYKPSPPCEPSSTHESFTSTTVKVTQAPTASTTEKIPVPLTTTISTTEKIPVPLTTTISTTEKIPVPLTTTTEYPSYDIDVRDGGVTLGGRGGSMS